MTNYVDNSEWWADVKYKDSEIEEVPVRKIREEYVEAGKTKSRCFDPQTTKDYDPAMFYIINSDTFKVATSDGQKPENRLKKYYGRIGRLAETREGLKVGGRIRYPPLNTMDDDEPMTTETEDESVPLSASRITAQKAKRVQQHQAKRSLQEHGMDTWVQSNRLTGDAEDPSEQPNCDTSLPQNTSQNVSHNVDLQEKIMELERRLAEKERENLTLKEKAEASTSDHIKSYLESTVKSLVDSFTSFKDEQKKDIEKLQKEVVDLKTLCKFGDYSSNYAVLEWLSKIPDCSF